MSDKPQAVTVRVPLDVSPHGVPTAASLVHASAKAVRTIRTVPTELNATALVIVEVRVTDSGPQSTRHVSSVGELAVVRGMEGDGISSKR
jgi:hypothetical protein